MAAVALAAEQRIHISVLHLLLKAAAEVLEHLVVAMLAVHIPVMAVVTVALAVPHLAALVALVAIPGLAVEAVSTLMEFAVQALLVPLVVVLAAVAADETSATTVLELVVA